MTVNRHSAASNPTARNANFLCIRQFSQSDYTQAFLTPQPTTPAVATNERTPSQVIHVTGGVSGGLGAYSASSILNVTQRVTLTLDAELATDMISQLSAAGLEYTAEKAGTDITVSVLQEVFLDTRFIDALEGLATGVVVAILTTIVKDLLIGENQKYEKSCISLNDEGQNITSFKEFVKWAQYTYPERARSLELMARIYTKPGTDEFDGKAMYEEFRNIAGRGSNLNCLEGFMAMIKGRKPEPGRPVKKPDAAPSEKVAVVTSETPQETKPVETPYDNTHIHKRQAGDSWGAIIKAYYPELGITDIWKDPRLFGKNGLIRQFKKALAYDENGTFHPEVYKRLLEDKNLPAQIKIPSEFAGAKRAINDTEKTKFTKKTDGKGKTGPSLKMVGHDEKGVIVSEVTINGQTIYTAKDKADPSKSAQDTTRDGAVAKLEAQQGVKYDKVIDL